MLMQMFRKLFGKRTKVRPFTKEKVKDNDTNDFKLEDFAQENKDQEHLQAEMKTLKTLEDGHEVLLSMHMIFKKHAECSENLLREMEKLTDAIKKTQFTPVPGFSPPSCSFSSASFRLPPIKELQYFSVSSSLHAVRSSPCSKLAWGENESISNDTEETFLAGDEMNETELQTVNEMFADQETKTSQNEPHFMEKEFHAKMDKWSKYEKEERLKLKLEIAKATLRRQKETKDLKLKINFLEKEAKREKQEMKKKLKDLEKEMKKEKAMLRLKLKELKKELKMEKAEECDEEKMEPHRQDEEKVDDVQYKNVKNI